MSTLSEALNRSLQLLPFHPDFIILVPKEYKERCEQKVKLEPHIKYRERYKFRTFDEVIRYYEKAVEYFTLKEKLF